MHKRFADVWYSLEWVSVTHAWKKVYDCRAWRDNTWFRMRWRKLSFLIFFFFIIIRTTEHIFVYNIISYSSLLNGYWSCVLWKLQEVLTRLRLASEPEVYEISKEINCFLKLYCFGLQFFVCVGDHLLQTTIKVLSAITKEEQGTAFLVNFSTVIKLLSEIMPFQVSCDQLIG